MNDSRRMLLFGIASAVFSTSSGCEVLTSRLTRNAPPRVLAQSPSLDDVTRVVNNNSAKVRTLYAPDATLTIPMQPSLRANIAMELPRRLRVRAETSFTGPEFDIGSNDQLFWVWVKRSQPPALYYGSHDRFYQSQARQLLPVQPEWLFEAFGLASFDITAQHTGPNPLRGGKQLEVRSTRQGPDGPQTKLTVIDASSGYVLEQHMYDTSGTLIASALTSKHQLDTGSGAILPRHVEIRWPATQFTLNVDLRSLQVNQPSSNASVALYELPSYPGAPPVDITAPTAPPGAGIHPAAYQPAAAQYTR